MSYPKPWILGSTIINDGIDWHAAEWGSILRGWQGLPRAQVLTAERYGTSPVVMGVRRPGRKLSLETHFLQAVAADRKLARKVYLQAIDYEDETPYRLLCTDIIPPNCATAECLLALGPLNVQTDGEGTWTLLDLVDPDNVEIPITGAMHFVAGPGTDTRAIVVEQTATNYILNSSFEVNVTDGWTNDAGNPFDTFEQSTAQAKFGNASLHCISGATADNAYSDTVADADGTETWTGSGWVYLVAGDFRLIVEENNAGWSEAATVDADDGLLNQWQKVSVTVTLSAGVTDARIKIKPPTTAASEFYVDGVDLVEASYVSTHIDGSLGPGYEWDTPTPHNDTSTRTETVIDLDDYADDLSDLDELSFRVVLSPQYDYDDSAWPQASDNPVFDLRGADNDNRIYCYFHNTTNAFVVYINGADRLEPSAVAFEAGDRLELVITLDFASDVYKLYLNGTLIDTDTTALTAPTSLASWKLGAYYTEVWQSGWAIEQYQVFSKEFTQAEVTLMNGEQLNARWLEVLCDQTDPVAAAGKETTLGFVATLTLHGDNRFRSRDGDAYFCRMYDASWDLTIDVDSEDLVRPVFYVTPEDDKTEGFLYKHWYPLIWNSPRGATSYPVAVLAWDTATIIAATEMQADGDDLRVYVDGVEVDRWLDGIDTANTNVWFNVDWEATVSLTLKDAMLIGDDVTYLDLEGDLSRLPTVGIVLIDSEAFAYSGKLAASGRLLNMVRAARGTAAAGHAADTAVYWVQHDIWVYYGDATLSAPTVDDDYKPVFELDTSTNSAWVFQEFGENVVPTRGGSWVQDPLSGTGECYTADHGTDASPWEEVGVYAQQTNSLETTGAARFFFYAPCGISNFNFSNGESYYNAGGTGGKHVQSSPDGATWTSEYAIAAGSSGSWNAWSRNAAPASGTFYIALYVDALTLQTFTYYRYLEAADCTITFDTDYDPSGSLGAQQTNYSLELTITNDVTGKTLELSANVQVDDVIEIDTDAKSAWNLTENVNLTGSIVQTDGIRREWLALLDGENTLTFADPTATSIAIDVVYDRRYYE